MGLGAGGVVEGDCSTSVACGVRSEASSRSCVEAGGPQHARRPRARAMAARGGTTRTDGKGCLSIVGDDWGCANSMQRGPDAMKEERGWRARRGADSRRRRGLREQARARAGAGRRRGGNGGLSGGLVAGEEAVCYALGAGPGARARACGEQAWAQACRRRRTAGLAPRWVGTLGGRRARALAWW
jgi:hypothetical protein